MEDVSLQLPKHRHYVTVYALSLFRYAEHNLHVQHTASAEKHKHWRADDALAVAKIVCQDQAAVDA